MLNCEIGLDFLENEPALVDGLQVGSREAFETLVRLYQAPIYNLAYRILGDSAEASEATQEAFVRIYKGIGRFRGECGLKTWIYRIAVSASLNRRRWWKRWKSLSVHPSSDNLRLNLHASTCPNKGSRFMYDGFGSQAGNTDHGDMTSRLRCRTALRSTA